MNFVNNLIGQILKFAAESEVKYHVNPWIFCILFFGSAIPLYYGYYRIGRSFIKLEKKKVSRKQVDKRELKIGLTIAIIAWWLPYLYVFIFGRLPAQLMTWFVIFVLVMGVFFVNTLRRKIKPSDKHEDNSPIS